jgi:epoxyqueuosine reductase
MSHKGLRASAKIIAKAKELGASLVGWASVSDLKKGPSAYLAPRMPYRRDEFEGAGHRVDTSLNLKHGEINWPKEAKSVLVIALEHPKDKPEMDWWIGRSNPPGNRKLINIIKALCLWINKEYGYHTTHFPYQVGKGGIYLKDAAVFAGIGCVGENNMVVTPEFGPRVRLRALTLDVDMPSTGPIHFNPCFNCARLCRRACPQKAMDDVVYLQEDYSGLADLPGRSGVYNVSKCDVQNSIDAENATEEKVKGFKEPKKIFRFCRLCEFSCPVGS